MREITVKGKITGIYRRGERYIGSCVQIESDAMGTIHAFFNPPADWQEGQEVEITIRTVTK